MITYYHAPFDILAYCLVMTKKEVKRVKKEQGIKDGDFYLGEVGGACVNFFDDTIGGTKLAVIHMPKCDKPLYEVLAILVHEAVHIKQDIMREINESSPSAEFEAYTIEDISSNLLQQYLERL